MGLLWGPRAKINPPRALASPREPRPPSPPLTRIRGCGVLYTPDGDDDDEQVAEDYAGQGGGSGGLRCYPTLDGSRFKAGLPHQGVGADQPK